MIIPCIDLMDSKAVQLVQGKRKALEVEDIEELLHSFAPFPVIHVIDLDAAKQVGNNIPLISDIVRRRPVRVGGGIRDIAFAENMIALGAEQIIVGTAAFGASGVNHAFLRDLQQAVGKQRICIALDSYEGKVSVRGWEQSLNLAAAQVLADLEPHCDCFLCTYVDAEGTMTGSDLAWFEDIRRRTNNRVIAAGGFSTLDQVEEAANIGVDVALGMAIYTGAVTLAALAALNARLV